jgi:hypothetical protein
MNKQAIFESLWKPAHVTGGWATLIERVGAALRDIEPTVRLRHHEPGQISGCTWDFYVDANARGVGARVGPWPTDAIAWWRVALSFRGGLITALSWSDPDLAEDQITDPKLVRLAEKIAQELRLIYLDAHELMALEIPWEDLQGDASNRLDWSEMPNAFNLLFYEY